MHHQHTYEAIFRHPAAHNPEWHHMHSLLAALADVAEGHDIVASQHPFFGLGGCIGRTVPTEVNDGDP